MPAALADAAPEVSDALLEYFDFTAYGAGQITVEQIPQEDYERFFILDVRSVDQFDRGHIPGANSIEWRQVYARRGELPRERSILVYCNSGSLAAQVAMALRIDGFDNVRMLYGGYDRWLAVRQGL